MKNRFWFGYLSEGTNKGSIVIFDKELAQSEDDQVFLYHFKRSEIVTYKKNIVRVKLRPINQYEKSITSAALSSYFKVLSEWAISQKSKKNTNYCPYNYYLTPSDVDKVITEYFTEYSEAMERSDEGGWFYED